MKISRSDELTSCQCRMARAGLRWSVQELSDISRIGKTTIVRFENDQNSSNASTRLSLRRTFEDRGVEFIDDYSVRIPKTIDKKAEIEQ